MVRLSVEGPRITLLAPILEAQTLLRFRSVDSNHLPGRRLARCICGAAFGSVDPQHVVRLLAACECQRVAR